MLQGACAHSRIRGSSSSGREGQAGRCMGVSRRRRTRMWWHRLSFWLLCLLHFAPSPTALSATLPSDVYALQEILQAWNSSPSLAAEWSAKGPSDPCGAQWRGVYCSGDTVTTLYLHDSGIVGVVPTALGNLANLQKLDLSGNPQLGGELPREIGYLSNLVHMDLSHCNISGNISMQWGALTRLEFMDVSGNAFHGAIPDFLFNLPNLLHLNLSFNQFSGTFNANAFQQRAWKPLQISLEHNNISAAEVGPAPNPALTATLGGNPLCDNASLPTPDLCDFANGIWGGPTVWTHPPPSGCNSTSCGPAEGVDPTSCVCAYPLVCTMALKWSPAYGLSAARFGQLQRELAKELHLDLDQVLVRQAGVANSSGDEVTAELEFFPPPGFGQRWDATQSELLRNQLQSGSANLTGFAPYRLLTVTMQSPDPARSQGRVSPKSKGNIAEIAGPAAAGALFLLLILVTGVICWRRKKASKPPSLDHSSELFGLQNQQPSVIISYEDVKAATRNFHRSNRIGEGAFGAVYKGMLSDGQEVAIKQLSAKSRRTSVEFMNEVQLITSVQHRNIVRLRGCAIGPTSRLLVYEYLENRSLAQALFDPRKGVKLDWPTRFNIALGTAQGLAHLHNKSQARLVHSDIKATNILLDKALEPKIADFGLARLFQNDSRKVHTFVAGARGYVAPEFALQGQLTSKADVFSFGIVALELVSGRKNMDSNTPKEQQYLLAWAWQLLEAAKILELIDRKVRDTCDETQALLLIRVALLCTQDVPADRPNMPRVTSMLTGDMPTPEVPVKPGFLAIGSGSGPSSRATSSTSLVALDL